MEIWVNGHKRQVPEGTTVAELLEQLKVREKTVAVAVNMEIVKKGEWERFKLKEGDRVEALQFVGGG